MNIPVEAKRLAREAELIGRLEAQGSASFLERRRQWLADYRALWEAIEAAYEAATIVNEAGNEYGMLTK